MNKRIIGNTGIAISELAFGGVEIGLPYGIGLKGREDMPDERVAIGLLMNAIESGVNFFDTARLYGESERIIGRAFKGKRDQVVIASKCRHFKNPDGTIPAFGELQKIVEQSIQESLEALQTDYIDLYMVHYADLSILENEDVARIFSQLKGQGRVRAIGVSVYEPAETEMAIETGPWNVIQIPFNLMDQRQGNCFSKAAEKGVGLIVRSVLMRGLLSNRGTNLHPALKDVEAHITQYQTLLGPHFNDLPDLAVKFALSFEEVSSVLVGIDKQAYLDQALQTVNGVYMNKEQLTKAKTMSYPNQEFLNLAQWDKNGWL